MATKWQENQAAKALVKAIEHIAKHAPDYDYLDKIPVKTRDGLAAMPIDSVPAVWQWAYAWCEVLRNLK